MDLEGEIDTKQFFGSCSESYLIAYLFPLFLDENSN